MNLTLPPLLAQANQDFSKRYPGESGDRRPVHVVYGGAHLFKANLCRKLGDVALRAFCEYAAEPGILIETLGIPRDIADAVHPRIAAKLTHEPVEDYRIDFEDGYGSRLDAEEDAHAVSAAKEAAQAFAGGLLPPFFGIRIKPLDESLKVRSFRTLERFLNTFLDQTGGRLPQNFVVTLPKITIVEQVQALREALDPIPDARIELMMETPQALTNLPVLLAAAQGRCAAVHFGPYDYMASVGITAAGLTLTHPACDFARSMMQATLAGTGVGLSDGPTTILPIAPYRGEAAHGARHQENADVVHRAWKLHYGHIRRALERGFYQGWDLHPAQLPIRYAAVFAFFLEGLEEASRRLRNFVDQAAQATRIGDVFDDAATGQVLLNYFLRAVRCGAIDEATIPSVTGLTIEELRTASFARILALRR